MLDGYSPVAEPQPDFHRRSRPIGFRVADIRPRALELLLKKLDQRFAQCLFVSHRRPQHGGAKAV
jgi:hypothetical protein